MQKRDPALVIVLMLVTCGLYSLYHVYVTTQEVQIITGKTDINPGMELVVNFLTCGLFGMFVEYRNAQLIDEWYVAQNFTHEPKANMVGMMNILTFFIGVTWLVATYIYQDELNNAIETFGAMHYNNPTI